MAQLLRICSYNVNGFSEIKTAYINNLLQTHDVLLLQEHWLYNSQSHQIQDNIPGISCYSVSGMSDTCITAGRRYGGCAVIWKSSLACTVEPICIDNTRICAVKLKFPETSILLCSIYMPCDTTYDDYNMQSYITVFNDILHNNVCNEVDQIIIGGDLNTDLSRGGSLHTKYLLDMCEKESLTCVSTHTDFNIDYTYESKINYSKSSIDHFIVSCNLFDSIEQFTVLHDGDNLSDHDPISMQIHIAISYDNIHVDCVSKPLWWKATDQQLSQYKQCLDSMLDCMTVPRDALDCEDRFCSEHQDAIQTYHDNIISACMLASSCIPHSKPGKYKNIIPGWSEHVKDYKDKSIFWHKLWKENGSPNNGILFDIRRKTRWEYHRILKIVKRNREALSAERLAGRLSGKGFWSEVKKVIGSSKTCPNNIDGIQGSAHIADLFKNKYNELYNSVGYDAQHMTLLRGQIDQDIIESSERYDISCRFTADDINDHVTLIKLGKSGGQNGHSSDNIRHGTRKLYIHLASLYNCMITHGFAPMDFRLSTLIPIPKNRRKSLNDSNNYRAIALSSILGKLLDHLLLIKFQDVFITSNLQYGFKKKHGTTQCSFVVNEIIQYYLNNDTNVNVTLLDASRAFDRVNYLKLFRILVKRKLNPMIIRFLIVLYTNQSIRVKWGSHMSILCNVTNGVKQGGVMSPILFNIYIDELLIKLRSAQFGCHIGNVFCGALGYADDVILLAPTLFSLRSMLKTCEVFSKEYDVLFNPDKTKLLFFGKQEIKPENVSVKFMDNIILPVDNDKHLGNIIGQNYHKRQIQEAINEFNSKVNMVNSHFHNVQPDVLYYVFKTYCMPLYGSQLWDHSKNTVNKFYVNWRKAIRKIFGLPNTTHCGLLPYICDDFNINIQLYHRLITFCRTLEISSNNLTNICYQLALNGSGSALCNNISLISNFWSVSRYDICNIDRARKHILPNHETIIYASIIRDLLYMKHSNKYYITEEPALDPGEIEFMLNCLCTE